MKCAVPITRPGSESAVSSAPRAMPKSVTSARPVSASMRMLSGLMSRWTIPRPCAYDSAHATSRIMRVATARRQRTARAQTLAERLAAHVRHGEEDEALGFADAIDRNDVRMRERRGHARLAQEALANVGARRRAPRAAP